MTRSLASACALVAVLSASVLIAEQIPADHYTKVVFQDDFSGVELGKAWRLYSSEARVEDGKLHAVMKPGHAAVQNVNVSPGADFEVTVRFKPVDKHINLVIAFNDRQYKDAHAGHICRVVLNPKGATFQDGKYGIFSSKVWSQREKDGKLNDESKKIVAAHRTFIAHPITSTDWSTATVRIQQDRMALTLNGRFIGSYQSEGIAHPTKRNIALVVGKNEMYLDDVAIKTP